MGSPMGAVFLGQTKTPENSSFVAPKRGCSAKVFPGAPSFGPRISLLGKEGNLFLVF